MKKYIFSISKVVLSVSTIPLWFVKMFVDVGHLPDQNTGQIVEVIFRHSMFENISDLAHPVLAYIAITVALFAAVCNVLVILVPNSKAVKTVSNILFWTAMGIFLILLLWASTVARGY